jgi:SAM-dependent methyltransferase
MSLQFIEILSVDLLSENRTLADEFSVLSKEYRIGLGWHYLLDLCWTAKQISLIPGMTVLDAGAGRGIMQWWLAIHGTNVISVDRQSRDRLPRSLLKRFEILGLRSSDYSPTISQAVMSSCFSLSKKLAKGLHSGKVSLYNQDLAHMPDIQTDSVDAIVSISALEHNPPGTLVRTVSELLRVLKPGGKLIATLAATRTEDCFHKPSKGWCYTENSLRKHFGGHSECPSNYADFDSLMTALRDCSELKENLAEFYFKSGDNGMPWGIWDPKYLPVGVMLVKSPSC